MDEITFEGQKIVDPNLVRYNDLRSEISQILKDEKKLTFEEYINKINDLKSEVSQINRNNKLESILESKKYEEMKLWQHKDSEKIFIAANLALRLLII